MAVRPSEFWGITWPLTAFFFDRGVRTWANYVDRQVEQAETNVRMQMRNAKRANVDTFAFQQKQVTFHKLMGLSVESLYAAPPIAGGSNKKREKSSGPKQKIDLDKIPGIPSNY